MKVGFATMEKVDNRPVNSVGSSRIRARWLINYWQDAEEYQVGQKYDVMVFQKAYWKEMIERFEGIKIFDLCDPDWLEPRPVVEVSQMCDAVVTSTEALANYLKKFVKNVPIICIPDRVDLSQHTPRGKHQGVAKSVVWFGYQHNVYYLEKTYQWLIDKGLSLTVITNGPVQTTRGFEKLKLNTVNYNYQSVHDEIKRHDFVLLPTTSGDLKGAFKSNNKVITSWALGMPVAREPEDLERFMNEDQRNLEQELRLTEVQKLWDVKLSVAEYKALIDDLSKGGGKSNVK